MANAVAILEYGSVARGISAADEMLKAADVKLTNAQTVCPGKYLIMVEGEVSAVQAAADRAKAFSSGLLDSFVSGRLHGDVLMALRACDDPGELESLGIVEAFSIPGAIQAADMAAKAAGVRLLEIRTSRGMGGKSFVLMTGSVGDVQAAADAVRVGLKDSAILDVVVIPRPDMAVWTRIT